MKTRSHTLPSETVDTLLATAFVKIRTAIDRKNASQPTLSDTDAQSLPAEKGQDNSLGTLPESSSNDGVDTETSGTSEAESTEGETEPIEKLEEHEHGRHPQPGPETGQTDSSQPPNQVHEFLNDVNAKDIMRTDMTWAMPDDSIQDVITKMGQHIPYILIGNDGKAEGLVSRSNIGNAIGTYLRPEFVNQHALQDDATLSFKLNWMKFKIKWMMNDPVHTIKPESSLTDAMSLMRELRIRCLPVVGDDEQILGMVTESDIFQRLQELSTSVP